MHDQPDAPDHYEVVNWAEYQHYKDRRPPWIKLHQSLLDDHGFWRLQDDSKLHLMLIFLIASKTDNCIPADEAWLTVMCKTCSPVCLKPLVDAGFLRPVDPDSKVLSRRKQPATPETETETEGEGERRRAGAKARPALPPSFRIE